MDFCKRCKHSQMYPNFDLEEESVCVKFGCSDKINKIRLCGGKYKEGWL